MWRRRDLLRGLLGWPLTALVGCGAGRPLPRAGEIVGAQHALGHRLREPAARFVELPSEAWHAANVVIVGGGVAGLSAAWELRRRGIDRVVVLELEPEAGGTSRGGRVGGFACPWGAHYLPVPLPHQHALLALLDELGVLEGRTDAGEPLVAEQFLCRDPEERLFYRGTWYEGLYLGAGADARDWRQWQSFQAEVARWAEWRDADGRRAFTLPVAECSTESTVTALDRLTMRDWLEQQGYTSARLRWAVDYACRDDYGLTVEQTSAWAGLFYFASRLSTATSAPQPLITWPEGNARLVRHLQTRGEADVRTGWLVTQVRPRSRAGDPLEVLALNTANETVQGWRASAVIWAAPQFVAPYVIHGFRDDPRRRNAAAAFDYGSWLVANLELSGRPRERGFPLAWDNVLYESPSLGYVVATHQLGIDHGPTVFTYYYPFCDEDPRAARQRLLALDWADCAELVLSDLETAHPDVRGLTTRLDVMRWGHAMIRPVPGFVWSPSRHAAALPWRGIHFAHTDLSGLPLFEEAFHHGVRAAGEVAKALAGESTA